MLKEVCKFRSRILKTIAVPMSDIKTSRRRTRIRMDPRRKEKEEDESTGERERVLSEGRFTSGC